MLPAFTLWWREVVRFYRQRARVVGVILSPLLFWIVIGSGFGTSFRSGQASGQQHYLDYFYPGTLVMIVLFTAIFTMMSVIEDRNEGFLLSVLVAPVPRAAIVLGKVLGGTTLGRFTGSDLSCVRAAGGRAHDGCFLRPYRADGLSGFVRADGARLCHRLAHGFHPGVSRHHQFVPDSAMAALGRALPSVRRFGLDSLADVCQPTDVRC